MSRLSSHSSDDKYIKSQSNRFHNSSRRSQIKAEMVNGEILIDPLEAERFKILQTKKSKDKGFVQEFERIYGFNREPEQLESHKKLFKKSPKKANIHRKDSDKSDSVEAEFAKEYWPTNQTIDVKEKAFSKLEFMNYSKQQSQMRLKEKEVEQIRFKLRRKIKGQFLRRLQKIEEQFHNEIECLKSQNLIKENQIICNKETILKLENEVAEKEILVTQLKTFCNEIVQYFTRKQKKNDMPGFLEPKKQNEEDTLSISKGFQLHNMLVHLQETSSHLRPIPLAKKFLEIVYSSMKEDMKSFKTLGLMQDKEIQQLRINVEVEQEFSAKLKIQKELEIQQMKVDFEEKIKDLKEDYEAKIKRLEGYQSLLKKEVRVKDQVIKNYTINLSKSLNELRACKVVLNTPVIYMNLRKNCKPGQDLDFEKVIKAAEGAKDTQHLFSTMDILNSYETSKQSLRIKTAKSIATRKRIRISSHVKMRHSINLNSTQTHLKGRLDSLNLSDF
ncbi:unnamed protein product [Moneuplotes crassus]|uniref:Uncharacterized protein n=1 Tax=Euplotes crassus TaxID=5936 RepID=A0AAD1TZD7_EUPCR|nr:unnamed protein product [Moneuplotes crassus]